MRCDVANCQDLFDKGGGHVIPDSRSVPSPPPFRPFVVTWCCCPPSDAHPWLSGTPISIPPPLYWVGRGQRTVKSCVEGNILFDVCFLRLFSTARFFRSRSDQLLRVLWFLDGMSFSNEFRFISMEIRGRNRC